MGDNHSKHEKYEHWSVWSEFQKCRRSHCVHVCECSKECKWDIQTRAVREMEIQRYGAEERDKQTNTICKWEHFYPKTTKKCKAFHFYHMVCAGLFFTLAIHLNDFSACTNAQYKTNSKQSRHVDCTACKWLCTCCAKWQVFVYFRCQINYQKHDTMRSDSFPDTCDACWKHRGKCEDTAFTIAYTIVQHCSSDNSNNK